MILPSQIVMERNFPNRMIRLQLRVYIGLNVVFGFHADTLSTQIPGLVTEVLSLLIHMEVIRRPLKFHNGNLVVVVVVRERINTAIKLIL